MNSSHLVLIVSYNEPQAIDRCCNWRHVPATAALVKSRPWHSATRRLKHVIQPCTQVGTSIGVVGGGRRSDHGRQA